MLTENSRHGDGIALMKRLLIAAQARDAGDDAHGVVADDGNECFHNSYPFYINVDRTKGSPLGRGLLTSSIADFTKNEYSFWKKEQGKREKECLSPAELAKTRCKLPGSVLYLSTNIATG